MKKFLIGAAFVYATASLTGCAGNAAKAETYDAIVADATATHAEAKKMHNVWKQKAMKLGYVEHYLDLAAKAKQKGDEAGAIKLAKEAQKTAHAEVAQMNNNANIKAAWEK